MNKCIQLTMGNRSVLTFLFVKFCKSVLCCKCSRVHLKLIFLWLLCGACCLLDKKKTSPARSGFCPCQRSDRPLPSSSPQCCSVTLCPLLLIVILHSLICTFFSLGLQGTSCLFDLPYKYLWTCLFSWRPSLTPPDESCPLFRIPVSVLGPRIV